MLPLFSERFPCETAVAIHGDKWRELPNADPRPAHAWKATREDAVWLYDNPPDLLIHSHPLPWGPAGPSDYDLQSQLKHGWNYGVVAVSGDAEGNVFEVRYPECWGQGIPVAPLQGRSYLFGIRDCVSICWDYYALNGIEVPRAGYVQYPMEYPEHSKERNQFELLPAKVGMREVPRYERKPGDLVIMQFNDGPTANHCAVYVGEGKYLHQPMNQLSSEWCIKNEDALIEKLNMRFWRPKKPRGKAR